MSYKEPPKSFSLEFYKFAIPYRAKYTLKTQFGLKYASEVESGGKGCKVVSQFNFKISKRFVLGSLEHILTIIKT